MCFTCWVLDKKAVKLFKMLLKLCYVGSTFPTLNYFFPKFELKACSEKPRKMH